MAPVTIVVADAARARIFTYARSPDPPIDHQPELNELVDLVDSERRMRPSARHSERPSTGVTPTGFAFSIDDHRDAHETELDRRFAGNVAVQVLRILESNQSRELVIVATPRFLGMLRPRFVTLPARGVELHEIAHDLTHEPPARLHDYLAEQGILRPRERREG